MGLRAEPNKRLGQHFLHDPQVIARIVASISPQSGDHIVEIGPGHGALTYPLAAYPVHLTVIELDRGLAAELASDVTLKAVTILRADALEIDYATLANGQQTLRIVGNLPYNISTPLLFRFLQSSEKIKDLTLMVQREVAERMSAKPGTREYGRLTVMLAARCRVEKLFKVGKGAFTPAPKVDSMVVRLLPHSVEPFDPMDWKLFTTLVRMGFAARRKTLRNALRSITSEAQIKAAGLDPKVRPDTLSPSEYAQLAHALALSEHTHSTQGSPPGRESD